MQTTLQTRAYLSATATQAFDAFGALYGRLERSIFAAYCASGHDTKVVDKLKPKFCEEFCITARQFNSCWVLLKGKIASRIEVDKLALSEVNAKLKSTRSAITKLLKQKKAHTATQRKTLERKRRKLAKLEAKFKRLSDAKVHLCFGSRKLFRQQYDLQAHGYIDHQHWLDGWQESRSNTFFLVGSKDETYGNQSCTPSVASNGTLTLRIRLPDALLPINQGEKYLIVENVWFERGQVEIYDALDRGCAISFKFLRDPKGWRILCSIEREDYRPKFNPQLGVVGLDLNEDHLALTETDRFGNLKTVARVRYVMQGKTAGQRKAVAQQAALEAVAFAKQAGKPLVMEKLDFSQKKKQLATLKGDPRLSRRKRQLSSFGYSAVGQAIRGRALLEAVPVAGVNPAFTSVIGRIKYAKRLGVSVHQAAALAIGRRGMGYSETCPDRGFIPDGKGDHLIVGFPVRKRSAHAWSHWGKVSNAVQATLAEWHRLRKLAALEASQTAQAVQGAP